MLYVRYLARTYATRLDLPVVRNKRCCVPVIFIQVKSPPAADIFFLSFTTVFIILAVLCIVMPSRFGMRGYFPGLDEELQNRIFGVLALGMGLFFLDLYFGDRF
jgi:hypothetical protein